MVKHSSVGLSLLQRIAAKETLLVSPTYSSLDEYVCSILRTYGVLQFHLLNIKGSVLS